MAKRFNFHCLRTDFSLILGDAKHVILHRTVVLDIRDQMFNAIDNLENRVGRHIIDASENLVNKPNEDVPSALNIAFNIIVARHVYQMCYEFIRQIT